MLKRNDIVVEKARERFFPARVWRRIDDEHVQIITVGQHVEIFRDDELALSDYRGRWIERSGKRRWLPMSSLRRLKYLAKAYNPHFGGYRYCGYKWTKADRIEALAER